METGPVRCRVGVGFLRHRAHVDYGAPSADVDGRTVVGKCGDRPLRVGCCHWMGHGLGGAMGGPVSVEHQAAWACDSEHGRNVASQTGMCSCSHWNRSMVRD